VITTPIECERYPFGIPPIRSYLIFRLALPTLKISRIKQAFPNSPFIFDSFQRKKLKTIYKADIASTLTIMDAVRIFHIVGKLNREKIFNFMDFFIGGSGLKRVQNLWRVDFKPLINTLPDILHCKSPFRI